MLQTLRFIHSHPLASRARARAYSRWARWQVGSRVLAAPVVCEWVNGTRLVVETGMTGATGNLYCGLHEFEDMAFVLHFLRAEDDFADVGANVGTYSILASGACGARTDAFEPHPLSYRRLVRNLRVNGLENRVQALQLAAGNAVATLRLTADRDAQNMLVSADHGGPTLEVGVVPLDQALAGSRPALIKMDVEGHEPAVLAGATRVLAEASLQAMLIEAQLPAIAEILTRHGFQRLDYRPFTRELVAPTLSRSYGNALWVRDRDFCSGRLRSAPPFTVYGQVV